jgi:endonuclease/exonuclease/phosphatase (EEP) superfamily protein YafD
MKKIIIGTLKLTVAISLLVSIYLLFMQSGWITTLLLSTAIQISIGCLSLTLMMVYLKSRRYVLAAFVSTVLFSTHFVGHVGKQKQDEVVFEASAPKLKIAHFNVLKYNSAKQAIISTIIASQADVVSLQETDEKWTQEIEKAVKKEYPFSIYFPSDKCCIGISLLSKKPLYNANISFHGGLPNIEADLIFNDVVTHIITSHTSSPISRSNLKNRNSHLKDLSDHVTKIDSPTIVIGDFNTVPWDNNLVDFKADTQLKDSRKKYESTFPSYFGKIGIPIDYIFHSNEISCVSFKTIKIKGSDHLGIIGEYAMN